MKIEKALEYAQTFKEAITRGDSWGLYASGGIVYKKDTAQLQICSDFSKQFMLLLLNTFIDVHNSLSKSLEANKDLQDAYRKYGEPFVHALQKSAEEHSHNFVQQWLDQHENDENNHLINFGPTNNEPEDIPQDEKLREAYKKIAKMRAHNLIQQWWNQLGFDPTNKESEANSPEESEEGIPQIVINIGELNVNFPTEDPKGFLAAVATPKNDPTEDDDKPSEEDMCDVVLEKCGNNSLLFAEQVNALLMDKTPFSIVAKLVTFLPSIIGNVPKREAEKFKQQAERTGAKVSIYELGTYNRVHPVHLHR